MVRSIPVVVSLVMAGAGALFLGACGQTTPRSPSAHQLSQSERLQLSRDCAADAEKLIRRKHGAGDEFTSTMPYVSHHNAAQGKCFLMVSTTWTTDNPFRAHKLEIVYDAIEGWEVAKLETLTWFDMPMTPNSPMHEAFKVNGDEVPASSTHLSDFRALMVK